MSPTAGALKDAAHALERGRHEEALRLLDTVLSSNPEAEDALLLKAEALVLADRWEEAEELLEDSARRLPKSIPILLALSDLIVEFHPDDNAALEEALAMLVRGEASARKQKLDGTLIGELNFTLGRALSAQGRSHEAIAALEAAQDALGQDPDLRVALAMARFEALRFGEARKELQALEQQQPRDARVHHYLGLIAEREGNLEGAERCFREARRLDPEEFPPGLHLSEEDFEKTVEKALASLPDRVREYIANVPVLVEDLPSIEDLSGQDPPLSPLSLGMFRGLPGGARSHFDPWSQLPSSIVLYQRNLERYARDRAELEEEIETTVLHEVGHYLGWDEEDLYERGLD